MFDVVERILFVVALCLGAYKFAHSAGLDDWQQPQLSGTSEISQIVGVTGEVMIRNRG